MLKPLKSNRVVGTNSRVNEVAIYGCCKVRDMMLKITKILNIIRIKGKFLVILGKFKLILLKGK